MKKENIGINSFSTEYAHGACKNGIASIILYLRRNIEVKYVIYEGYIVGHFMHGFGHIKLKHLKTDTLQRISIARKYLVD